MSFPYILDPKHIELNLELERVKAELVRVIQQQGRIRIAFFGAWLPDGKFVMDNIGRTTPQGRGFLAQVMEQFRSMCAEEDELERRRAHEESESEAPDDDNYFEDESSEEE